MSRKLKLLFIQPLFQFFPEFKERKIFSLTLTGSPDRNENVKNSVGLLKGGCLWDMASFRDVFVLILISTVGNDEFTGIET